MYNISKRFEEVPKYLDNISIWRPTYFRKDREYNEGFGQHLKYEMEKLMISASFVIRYVASSKRGRR